MTSKPHYQPFKTKLLWQSITALQRCSIRESGEYKYYAKAQASGSVGINELSEEIAYATTLTDGDVLNVIRALVKRINLHIAAGQIVKLENLGSFQAQLRSTGTATEDTFSSAMIKKVTLQFRPGIGLKGQLNIANLSFHKVKSLQEDKEEPLP